MADNSNNRKKALIISVLAFLFAGGGIFLFFVVQGANDITGAGKKNTFSYGFAVREAVLPLFKRMGFSTVEDEMIDATAERMKARGIEPVSEVPSAPADVSDWMAQAPSGSAAAPSGRSGSPSSVPKMAGRAGSPVGGIAGGGSKSAGGATRFGEGSASGMTSISGKGQAGAQGVTEKGTLAALKNSRALLGEGLRSNSAMTASTKWGQSFGVGSGGSGSGGNLAYNKSGLVALDKIKSGEISNLKMDKKGGLKTPDVAAPKKDDEGTAEALSKDKDYKKAQDDAIKKQAAEAALKEAEAAITKPKAKDGETSGPQAKTDPNKPPEEVAKLAANSEPPEGKYCPSGCETKGGDKYKDNPPDYKKEGDVWTVTYTGEQCSPSGDCFKYSDTMAVLPGSKPPIQPLSSVCNGKPCSSFGGAPGGS